MLQRYYFHLIAVLLALGACQGYDYKINDQVVYTPDPLFENYLVPDEALRECLIATIETNYITEAGHLKALNCSHAGIVSLDGLATFASLVSVRLSSNDITNLVELTKLSALRELYLDDNQIIDVAPLITLSHLRDIDLSKNPELQCPESGAFERITVNFPDHCR